jgi:GxxExxY protein
MKIEFEKISEREEMLAQKIVDAAYTIHKALGPGLLEKVYEACFCHGLTKRVLSYQRQVDIPIEYDGTTFEEGLRLDVMIEGLIICEIKAADKMNPVWEAQLLSYLKLTGKRLGFLINCNVPVVKNGIKRDCSIDTGIFNDIPSYWSIFIPEELAEQECFSGSNDHGCTWRICIRRNRRYYAC